MILNTPAELKSRLATGQRLLALDIGDKTIGLATSDETLTIASPAGTLPRKKLKNDLQFLEKTVTERSVGGLVAGLPLNIDGTPGTRAQSVRDYATALAQALALPLLLWDERLSTNAVMRDMQHAAVRHTQKKAMKDQLAAVVILQGVLDVT